MRDSYIEKPGTLTFDEMRHIAATTPLIASIINTRIRQISNFAVIQEEQHSPGFTIKHRELNHQITDDEMVEIDLIKRFIANGGWEQNPRVRRRLGRQTFRSFLSSSIRDSLTLDACPIELELKGAGGIDGYYVLDGATIRLCGPAGYRGDKDVVAVQVVDGVPEVTFTDESIIYPVRNESSDIRLCGYGTSEIELMLKIVTGYLNAFAYNNSGFDQNSVPAGIWTVIGDFPEGKITEFERRIKSQGTGAVNAWRTVLMAAKDKDSKITFEPISSGFSDIHFEKWFSFLTSIGCAIYGISPEEIGFGSFSDKGGLIGNNSYADRISSSQDKGLVPILTFYESVITDYIISEISPKYVFRFEGLKPVDTAYRQQLNEKIMTVNELRAQIGAPEIDEPWAQLPLAKTTK